LRRRFEVNFDGEIADIFAIPFDVPQRFLNGVRLLSLGTLV
jgi:hypothetical protein